MELQSKKDFLVNLTFFCVTAFIIILNIRFAFSYLFPFLIGIIIAYIMQKPAVFISEKIKISKGFAAATLSVICYVLILGILTLIIWVFFSNISHVMNLISSAVDIIVKTIEKIKLFFASYFEKINFNFKTLLTDTTRGFGQKLTSFIYSSISNFVKGLPSFFVSCIVTVVATCYIAKEFDVLTRFFKNIISKKAYENYLTIKEIFISCILKFSLGYLLLMGITFIELILGLSILGFKNVFVIALVISVVDLLPILGTGTILLPWSISLFLQENYLKGTSLIILYLIICVVRNILEPKIIGKQINFNPLLTLITMFLGLKLAGVAGLVLLPITVIIVFTYYKRQMLKESNL